jgi:hypothetical protein
MKGFIPLLVFSICLLGCEAKEEAGPPPAAEAQVSGATVEFTQPDAMAIPEYIEPTTETDWKARVNNKEIEIIQVLNIINPVAAYLTAGFDQYGDRIADPTVHEEWGDTQVQLTQALGIYNKCKEAKAAGSYSKQLFLDMEEAWQMLVKTGVAGVRTKSMLDSELKKL